MTPRYDSVAARRVRPPAGLVAPPSFARAFTPSAATPTATLMSPPPPAGEQRVPDPAGNEIGWLKMARKLIRSAFLVAAVGLTFGLLVNGLHLAAMGVWFGSILGMVSVGCAPLADQGLTPLARPCRPSRG